MVRLLEAFDRGLDLDAALAEVFETTPEEIDRDFERFVAEEIAGLRIEPTWEPERVRALRLHLREAPPAEDEARGQWIEDWCTVAWGTYQQGRRVDAEQALRVLALAGESPPRAAFLRGRMAFQRGDESRARELWEEGLAAGGDDFRVRMRLGGLASEARDWDAAEREFLAAEACFPGFPSADGSAELALASLYQATERKEERALARRRWLRYEAGDYITHRRVALHFLETERFEQSAELYAQANEIDPFRRRLHREWAQALRGAGRHEEALREVRMCARIPVELDGDEPGPILDGERSELLGLEALVLLDLERTDEAAETARRALELDPEQPAALDVLDRVP